MPEHENFVTAVCVSRIVSGMISSLLRAEESGIMPLAAEVLGDHSFHTPTLRFSSAARFPGLGPN